jgi:hypothetical protein
MQKKQHMKSGHQQRSNLRWLRWHSEKGNSQEIVRQQWNFSPSGSVRKIEDYAVDLCDVRVLEMIIVPDKNGGQARASLRRLRLA